MRYVVIDETFTITNVIVWDGISNWSPPTDHSVYQSDTAQIGDIFTPPVEE